MARKRALVRGRCKNCKSAFSAETRAKLRELLAGHDCAKAQASARFFERLQFAVFSTFAGELLAKIPVSTLPLNRLPAWYEVAAPKTPGHKRHRNPMAKPVEKTRKKGGPQ
jgi:hypothetical protein